MKLIFNICQLQQAPAVDFVKEVPAPLLILVLNILDVCVGVGVYEVWGGVVVVCMCVGAGVNARQIV